MAAFEYVFLKQLQSCRYVARTYAYSDVSAAERCSNSSSSAGTSDAAAAGANSTEGVGTDSDSSKRISLEVLKASRANSKGLPCIIMQWVEAGSLASLLNPAPGVWRPMSPRATWRVITNVFAALKAMHAAGIVFRDLTPGNVLVTSPPSSILPSYSVCDFESATRLSGHNLPLNDGRYGTPGFLAPDMLYTWLSDTWQLGLLLLACRTEGVPPNCSNLADISSEAWQRLLPIEQELLAACFADHGQRVTPAMLQQRVRYFSTAPAQLPDTEGEQSQPPLADPAAVAAAAALAPPAVEVERGPSQHDAQESQQQSNAGRQLGLSHDSAMAGDTAAVGVGAAAAGGAEPAAQAVGPMPAGNLLAGGLPAAAVASAQGIWNIPAVSLTRPQQHQEGVAEAGDASFQQTAAAPAGQAAAAAAAAGGDRPAVQKKTAGMPPPLPSGIQLSLGLKVPEVEGDCAEHGRLRCRTDVGSAAVVLKQLLARGGNGDAYLARLTSFSLSDPAAAAPWGSKPPPKLVVLKLGRWPHAGIAGEERTEYCLASRRVAAFEYVFLKQLQSCMYVVKTYAYSEVSAVERCSSSSSSSAGTTDTAAAGASSTEGADSDSSKRISLSGLKASTANSKGLPCIIMQWVEAGSLASLLNPAPGVWRPMSPRATWHVITNVFTALEAMHKAGIVFPDLTPGNVLVTSPPNSILPSYSVCDFECATRLTGTHLPLNDGRYGTPGFMAPDMLYTWLSDTWQLGLLLLACRTEGVPPNGSSLADISSSEAWQRLLPIEQELLAACFAEHGQRVTPAMLLQRVRYLGTFPTQLPDTL